MRIYKELRNTTDNRVYNILRKHDEGINRKKSNKYYGCNVVRNVEDWYTPCFLNWTPGKYITFPNWKLTSKKKKQWMGNKYKFEKSRRGYYYKFIW